MIFTEGLTRWRNEIFIGPDEIKIKAAELVTFFHIKTAADLLSSRVNDENESPRVRAASLQALFDLHDTNLMGSIRFLVRDDGRGSA